MIKTTTTVRSALTLAALSALLLPVTLAGAREIADPPVVNLARLGSPAALTADTLNDGLAAYAFTAQTADDALARVTTMESDFTRLGFRSGWQQNTSAGHVQTYALSHPALSVITITTRDADGTNLTVYALEGHTAKGPILY